ncbi:MAG: hypothetical protein WC184_12900 [Acidimicrobiia bacterium]
MGNETELVYFGFPLEWVENAKWASPASVHKEAAQLNADCGIHTAALQLELAAHVVAWQDSCISETANRDTPWGTKVVVRDPDDEEKRGGIPGWFLCPDLNNPDEVGLIKPGEGSWGWGQEPKQNWRYKYIFVEDWED